MRCYTAAATLLLLLVPLAAEAAIASYGERTEEETRRVFVEWMAKHGMAYESAAEEERRYAIFKDKLRIVEQHNAGADAGIHPYRLGLNSFSDRTSAETCCQQTKNRNKKRNKESLTRSGGTSAASVWLKDSILCGMTVDVALTNHPRLLGLLEDNGTIVTCFQLGHS